MLVFIQVLKTGPPCKRLEASWKRPGSARNYAAAEFMKL